MGEISLWISPPLPTYAPPFPLLFRLPLVAVAAWTERPQGRRKFSRRRTEKILYFKKKAGYFAAAPFSLSFFSFGSADWFFRHPLTSSPPRNSESNIKLTGNWIDAHTTTTCFLGEKSFLGYFQNIFTSLRQ